MSRYAGVVNHLENKVEHPLYKYFIKNWDGIQDEWVSYKRWDVPHLGNNTNNRIEAKWAKLKDIIRPTATVDETLSTLIGLQGICENEYEVELNKVGTNIIPADKEYATLDDQAIHELGQLVNMNAVRIQVCASIFGKIQAISQGGFDCRGC